MSHLPNKLRDYTYDKDNMPRMKTEVVYVRVRHLEEAAARIEQLEAALREIVDYCDNTGKWEPITMTRIIERVDDCARAALEEK